ncbi:MAG: lipid-binding SYLF domain-containing protein [Acidobacteria bacterium]|nr:lipid-binding SYLF domain-containing protein [Acidobacteriota bacterium]MBV9479744.1 lipid-binding SYLF domain-containing protein [Acidobacteriota bacterium]
MRSVYKSWFAAVVVATFVSFCCAQSKADHANSTRSAESDTVRRLNDAAKVLDEIMNIPDKGIPEGILASAKCLAVVPSLIKGGFIVGGRYGKGVATCRNKAGWSGPAPFTITGGSWGLQFGGEEVDLIMIVTNEKGLHDFLTTRFKLGAGASVAAGPVGRNTEASTDAKLESEILSYSRSRGVFAGLDLNGAVIKQDSDGIRELYGRVIPFKAVLLGKVPPPEATRHFLTVVEKWATPSVEASQSRPEPEAGLRPPAR